LPFAAITVFLLSLVIRARAQKVVTGPSAVLNTFGVALTEGKVYVRGEYWDAISAMPIAPGTSIRVIGVEGLTLTVEPVS
jgi:membrane-bound serine protease (ClpP class)